MATLARWLKKTACRLACYSLANRAIARWAKPMQPHDFSAMT
ncbi:hypothetical protein BF49_0278 [Bradyrhizobium sp.]|nr:hypothetical protein BF49_0278 [Bradyrhizobium sp.]